ncbi:TadE/TadG family type IV pilus assembly protein [Sphingomonas sp. HITSZ_GF]|uniref:TadE/TadG family type IV pilus assembly protein n=1 Tax=Sphingomonas sp. HITSZ_GF TaxID=3037247 RepID=UPI00240D394F|nr:TadE/TadG family type IV pilus assembly protein [Sphingomonas sp. HITSZ_GF]MDG2532826.1 TadE/TadG family type IV pilus assembly protein [Sphingomonas sp. HITSZ_GF]
MIGRLRLRRLREDERGTTIVEFAMIAPVMGVLLLGAFDIAHTLYLRAVLQGIVQKVGRDSSLETGLDAATQATLDAKVSGQAKALSNNATVTITRKWYRTFTNAAAAQFEPFTDTNGNGTCDGPQGSTPGEPYEDNNGNGRWDSTGGNTGSGGAKDAMVYTVSVTYPSMFPLYRFIGGPTTKTVTASTVLRNQPYGDQGSATVRNCP